MMGCIHSELLMWRRAREHHVLVEWRVFRLIVKWHYHGHCWIFRQVVGRDITWSCKHLKTHDQYGPTGSYQHVNSCYSSYRSHHRNEITRQLAARLGLTFLFLEKKGFSLALLDWKHQLHYFFCEKLICRHLKAANRIYPQILQVLKFEVLKEVFLKIIWRRYPNACSLGATELRLYGSENDCRTWTVINSSPIWITHANFLRALSLKVIYLNCWEVQVCRCHT